MAQTPRWQQVSLDALAALGFLLLPQISLLRSGSDRPDEAVAWLLAAGVAAPLVARRYWPVVVFVITLVGANVALVAGLGPTLFCAAAYALYPVATRQRRPRASAALVGGSCLACVLLLTVSGGRQYQGGTGVLQLIVGLLVLGVSWAAGTAVGERRERTRFAIQQAAERAKVEERLRIARDVHDIVTHSVGLIVVKAGVANHVVQTRPEEARQALAVIEEVGRKALEDMRATLTMLRREQDGEVALTPVPGLDDLPEQVRIVEAAGVRVALSTRYEEELPQPVALSASRIVQEALTNVVKHAGPTRCRVNLEAAQGLLRVTIEDDGPGTGGARRQIVPGSGLGLVGMTERATVHGGTLSAQPRPEGGFRVRAELPYRPVPHSQV